MGAYVIDSVLVVYCLPFNLFSKASLSLLSVCGRAVQRATHFEEARFVVRLEYDVGVEGDVESLDFIV